MDLRCYSDQQEKIRLTFWPCNQDPEISREAWLKIIDAIQSNEATNAQEKHFYASFLQWIESQPV